ncbi:MAG: CCA tRNA nucleotidyltransferase [Clostridiales bacterium]|jgi:tRNA nucleotidyltransferase (CCA-adding enzyme)|nr:CCA tRNA nucleotidyltransferase [Bacillota bacterium]NLK02823.1 CCA tRNA nucleotidyltransferase [Clostridiales bacterium]
MKFQIPEKVRHIIGKLHDNGFEAYAVGGCVRDLVLGKEPEDWDITTSAKPREVKRIFRRTVDTGIIHGTVTVLLDKDQYEVTTYRLDGIYEDNRHPKEVSFTSKLEEDLRRRDFTINAMAYNPDKGIIDLFGGMEDINKAIIRCVGDPSERFEEDALRILRAVRFSAQLGFKIEEDTKTAIKVKANLLKNISAERIRIELTKLLVSDNPDRLRTLYELGISKVILPELDKMMETPQKNIHHAYSVGEHTIKAVSVVAGKSSEKRWSDRERCILRWTMFLHDIEKPNTITMGTDGQNHFYGHQEKGAKTAKQILKDLKFDNDTLEAVVHLVRWHDYRFVLSPKGIRRAASKIGKEYMDLLFEVNYADTSGKNPKNNKEKFQQLEEAKRLYKLMLINNECVSLKELDISGKDLIAAGFKPGKKMGLLLNHLLDAVIEDPTINKKEILLNIAKDINI